MRFSFFVPSGKTSEKNGVWVNYKKDERVYFFFGINCASLHRCTMCVVFLLRLRQSNSSLKLVYNFIIINVNRA